MWKRAKARFAPTIADLDARVKGLVALVDSFKRRLAEEKAEAERKARAEADAARRAAEQAARRVDASDLATVRAAQEAQRAAEEAADRAARASRDKVKGLRTVTRYEIVDHRKLLHFIVANDCDAVAGFVDAWAAKHYKDRPTPDGLNVWQTKEAF
jgi:vacuolar-type H+-ATPase subunit E/Vma4